MPTRGPSDPTTAGDDLPDARPSHWVPPYVVCDFCRKDQPDRRGATVRAHLQTCEEYVAYRLDPPTWLRTYWLVRGSAYLKLVRVAGRPHPAALQRIDGPENGRIYGVLYSSVFPTEELARSYGSWRLHKLADGYHRTAEAFAGGDDYVDEAGAYTGRTLPLPVTSR